MKRIFVAAIAVALGLASSAKAYIITAGTFNISNQANQSITLAVTPQASDPNFGGAADPQVAGFVMRAQLGDGAGAGIEPKFVSFDFSNNTIFSPPTLITFTAPPPGTGVVGPQSSDANPQVSIRVDSPNQFVTANGNLINIVLDASNINAGNITNGGNYTFNLLTSPDFGASSVFIVSGGTNVAPTSANITVHVSVPEPTGALSLAGITGLLALRRRRIACKAC